MSGFSFLGPEDLPKCQRVFDQICADVRSERSEVDGELLPSKVFWHFSAALPTMQLCWLRCGRAARTWQGALVGGRACDRSFGDKAIRPQGTYLRYEAANVSRYGQMQRQA